MTKVIAPELAEIAGQSVAALLKCPTTEWPMMKAYRVAPGHPNVLVPCLCGEVHLHGADLDGAGRGMRSPHCRYPNKPFSDAAIVLVDGGQASNELLASVYGKGFKREIAERVRHHGRSKRIRAAARTADQSSGTTSVA